MDLYAKLVEVSTPNGLAQLLQDTDAEAVRYRKAFYAARAVIRALPAQLIPQEAYEKFKEYEAASVGI